MNSLNKLLIAISFGLMINNLYCMEQLARNHGLTFLEKENGIEKYVSSKSQLGSPIHIFLDSTNNQGDIIFEKNFYNPDKNELSPAGKFTMTFSIAKNGSITKSVNSENVAPEVDRQQIKENILDKVLDDVVDFVMERKKLQK